MRFLLLFLFCFASLAQEVQTGDKVIEERTPLKIALDNGDLKVADLLIESGADIHEKDEKGRDLLTQAVSDGDMEKVQFLLKKGAVISTSKEKEKILDLNSALLEAIKSSNLKLVEELFSIITDLSKINAEKLLMTAINKASSWNSSAFIGSLFHEPFQYTFSKDRHEESIEIIDFLLKKGIKVNTQEPSLLVKAVSTRSQKLVQLVLESGVDPNTEYEDKFGSRRLALLEAVLFNDYSLVKLLLDNKANVNIANKKGNTALMYAVKHCFLDIVRLLILNDANVNAVNKDKQTAFDQLSTKNSYSDIELQNKQIIQEMLIKAGAVQEKPMLKSYLKRQSSTTLSLIEAVKKGDKDKIKLLVTRGAKINSRYINAETILMYTARKGDVETGKLLIDLGADLNAVEPHGRTALMLAVYKGRTEFVELLLKSGADVNITARNGHSALTKAKIRGDKSLIQLLKKFGAVDSRSSYVKESKEANPVGSCKEIFKP